MGMSGSNTDCATEKSAGQSLSTDVSPARKSVDFDNDAMSTNQTAREGGETGSVQFSFLDAVTSTSKRGRSKTPRQTGRQEAPRRAKPTPGTKEKVNDFIRTYGLDDSIKKELKSLTSDQQLEVIGCDARNARNPNAYVKKIIDNKKYSVGERHN